jgi:hypothetical protein
LKTYKLIVLAKAKVGRDADLTRWYVRQHMPDMLRIPGFSAARLFRAIKTPESGFTFYAEFEMRTEDLAQSLAEMVARQNTPLLPFTDASDPEFYFSVYEPITPVVTN